MSDKQIKLEMVFVKSLKAVFVYSHCYCKSVELISKYVTALKEKYPHVSDSDITIDIFGGDKLDRHIYVRTPVGEPVDGLTVVEDENYFY